MKKESHVPAPMRLSERPKPAAPAPALTYGSVEESVRLMEHQKRLQMIRELEEIIRLEQSR